MAASKSGARAPAKKKATAVTERDARRQGPTKEKAEPTDTHGSSLVKQAVDALRTRILSAPKAGAFLGSEEQLIAEVGVSRPTFRQAARLLEHEMLLKIKRGIGGGFFAQPPSTQAVSRMAAIYLSARTTTLQHVANAIGPVLEEAAALLAASNDTAAPRRLAAHVAANAGFDGSADEGLRVRAVREFETLVGELCGNPAIALLLHTLLDLVHSRHGDQVRLTRERAAVHATFHRQLLEAVQRGDPDIARLLTRRHVTTFAAGLPAAAITT